MPNKNSFIKHPFSFSGIKKGYQDLLKHILPKPRLDDYSLEAAENTTESCIEFFNQSEKFLGDPLTSDNDKKFLRMVKYETDTCVRGYATKGYLLAPINHKYGVQTELYGYFKKNDTLKYNTLGDYLDNLDLLAMIPQLLKDIQTLLKEGVKKGITYANESMYHAFDQFEKLQVTNVEDSPFYTQFSEIRKNIPDVTDGQVDHVQIRAKAIILNEILPEFKRLQEYIFEDYVKDVLVI